MLFHSLDYLLFLTLAVCAYWLLSRHGRVRLGFVFLMSCLFYMAWHPAYIVLILGATVFDFFAARAMHASRNDRIRRLWLIGSVCANLGLLGTFKYFDFFSGALEDGFALMGAKVDFPALNVMLPVGISFYTFETLSYTIDVYRRRIEPTRSLLKFAFFITYFPKLVAGPIVRAGELLPQLDERPKLTAERVGHGLFLIATGLVKKVAIADYLSINLVDRVFDNPEAYTATEVVLGLYGFTMQIYADFSGYTDVARGSAHLMGLDLPENFDRPYKATSPADFWRRWHMTLSTWLRDYLYFPLGGSRGSPVRAYFNLWLTMFLIGLWHGAGWTFVLYGILQATAMVLHRFVHRHSDRPKGHRDAWAMHALKIAACLQFVVFSRILFRATSVENAWNVTRRLFSGTTSVAQISAGVWLVLLLSFAAHYTPNGWFRRLETGFVRLPAPAQGVALFVVAVLLSQVATSAVVPYIYFQF